MKTDCGVKYEFFFFRSFARHQTVRQMETKQMHAEKKESAGPSEREKKIQMNYSSGWFNALLSRNVRKQKRGRETARTAWREERERE